MKIVIGKGSCGLAAGALKVEKSIREALTGGEGIEVKSAGCVGMCFLEPIVDVYDDGGVKKTYVKVNEDVAREIVKNARGEDNEADKHLLSSDDEEFLTRQTRVALRNCGVIDPEDIDEYIEKGGYEAVRKALEEMTPDQVIDEIKASGLAGRGGAGFPTWFKWRAARQAEGDVKYVICNADEGDPGAFMDRAVIEGDPHSLIEGMIIAAYAIGASEGVVYARAEYPLAIKRLEKALEQAREKGFLGEKFDIYVKAGAGAFVCGEETALIASLEGERGTPRLKPPFPAQKGFWQKPSNINNVETYANVPWIIQNGGGAFSAMGSENSKGTKVFALTGKIKNGGLVEIPMGATIRDVIFGIGAGIKDDRPFKAVQMGGPSGGCIPAELVDTIIDYKEIAATGAIMGSGGMVVMDEATCMVDMARFFLDFTRKESCGKCVHCRIGTKRMLEILTRVTEGRGKDGDIELLESIGKDIKEGSLCGLGQTAPNPVLTTIKYFRHEYEAHIYDKRCTAKHCAALLTFSIENEKCVGCSACAKNCPVGAIDGAPRAPHEIDLEKCVKCRKCVEVCHFDAVSVY
ncbi:MAG: NADH-quinone oxidoreductase subunit NuoF [Clostridiales bacterium]|jgi:NADH-quinone oxidoreductase subunit F|nr:NADH-quinone oxidoreductase subunit NuoF [Clostridiales bacterium]